MMTIQEAKALREVANSWRIDVYLEKDPALAKKAIDRISKYVKNEFGHLGIRLGRGWQIYDPVIRKGNKAETYRTIFSWAGSSQVAGVEHAKEFMEWAGGSELQLSDLPSQLQCLAFITHVAEVARGYTGNSIEDLYGWLQNIIDGTSTWGQGKVRYSASLTAKEDGDYVPSDSEDDDSSISPEEELL